MPWYVDTRLLFYRRDLLRDAGFAAPPPSLGASGRSMLAAIERGRGRDRYAILLPLNEFEPLLALALQQDEPLLRDDGRCGNFRSAGFRRALAFYVEHVPATAARRRSRNTAISNVWDEFGRGRFAFYIIGPWNIGEFQRRLPADRQHELDDGAAARARRARARRSPAARASWSSARSRHKEAAWQLIEFLSQPDVQRRFHALTGDLPPRRSAWHDPRARGDAHARAFRDQLERVKPPPKVPEWERIATEMRLVAERVGRTAAVGRTRPPPSSTPAPIASSRSAAGCSTRRDARGEERRAPPGASSRRRWSCIGVFFVLPVLAALGAEPHRLRHLRARRPRATCASSGSQQLRAAAADAAVLEGAGQHALLRRRRRAAVDRRCRSAPRCCSIRRLARFQAFFRTALFAPVVTTLVAVAVIWRYLLHTRYGLLNYGLGALGIAPIDWLGDPHWAMPAIILFAVWKNFGYNMIIFLAGLQSIPRDAVRGGAHRRRSALAAVPPRHAADARADRCCWSAS